MLEVLGLEDCWPPRAATGRTRPRRTCCAAARTPGPPRTGPRPTACATSWPPAAGRCATGRTARRSSPVSRPRAPRRRGRGARAARPAARRRPRRRGPLRPQPRPRGAARRPPGDAPRLGHLRGGARAVAGRARRGGRRRRRARRAGRHRRPPGPVRATSAPYPYADAAALLAGPDPWLVALDEVQDPQNVGAICRTAECAGADGVVLPERRAAAVTPAVAKASAGAVEHLPSPACATSPTSWPRPRPGGLLVLRRRGGPRAVPYDEPDYAGGAVLVLGRRGPGLRPRVAGGLRPARGPAAARAHRVAQRLGRGGCAAVRDLAARARPP